MTTEEARDLLARLLHRIAPEADLDALGDEESLHEALGLDSIDFLDLVAALHEETGIDVPEQDYPALATIAGFTAYVAQAGGARYM